MKMEIPDKVTAVLDRLSDGGYEAYLVGGCVRDCLLGKEPADWDVAASATPEQISVCFSGMRVIETGLQHGTLTVLSGGLAVEITTYRIDGEYSDHRRPDSVKYASRLKDDLCRRDFTINAMAYNPSKGLIDYFGGQADLDKRIIRCVGDPLCRFDEDALRIFRAIRFASQLSFVIEDNTKTALLQKRVLLKQISSERIRIELIKLLCGANAQSVLFEYYHVIGEVIPEILPMIGFMQHSPYHIYDVWQHTLKAVEAVGADPVYKLTMLFHDIGKPTCYSEDQAGRGHFYGHADIGAKIADKVMTRLKFDNYTKDKVVTLIKNHSTEITTDEKIIKRRLNKLGEDVCTSLLKVIKADSMGKEPVSCKRALEEVEAMERALNLILEQKQCFSLKQLDVTGNDLIKIGVPEGKAVGAMLKLLLSKVINGDICNEKEEILSFVNHYIRDNGSIVKS